MKSVTHNLFSAGLGFYLLSHSGLSLSLDFLLAIWLSLSINTLIDVGHIRREGVAARSFLTHSIITAPLWGGTVGIASVLAPSMILKLDTSPITLFAALVIGIMVSYSHLLLDSLTQAGVFFIRHRIAIAHFDYDNVGLNLLFAAMGVILLSFPLL